MATKEKRIRAAVVGALAAAGMAWSMAASAITISDAVRVGANTFSDNDAELLINVDNSTAPGGGATVTPGDILISVLGFNQYNAINGAFTTNEMTALTVLQVGSATPTAPTNCGGATSCATYTFNAVGDFNAVTTAAGLGTFTNANGSAIAPGSGTVGVVFLDNSR